MTGSYSTHKQTCSFALGRAPSDKGDGRLTISTSHADREGDVLVPEGALLENYRRNPIVLFAHDHYSIPVGKTVAIRVVAGVGLEADFVFLKDDEMAARISNAYEQGVLNAASVGFRPVEWEPLGKSGRRYTKWELLEWSIVEVPANPHATRLLKSLGWQASQATEDVAVIVDESASEPICHDRRKINVSQVFAGQKVGVRQTDDHIWLVTFMTYDLGYFDDETCRLEPIDNPFGPKLLPMSPE